MTEVHEGIKKWLAATKPALAPIEHFSWTGPDTDQFFEFLKRSAIIRQTEALEAMLALVDANHGHFGVTFLRPAYEELIWVEYLNKHQVLARELVRLLATSEITATIVAQNNFVDAKTMAVIGFSQKEIKKQQAKNRKDEARIREIGRELGWNMDRALLPSVAWLSRKVGRERDYKFLYHATSRFVHFSVHELYRRVWGKQGKVKIGSGKFSPYWQNFSLYWGFRIYLDLCIECSDLFGDLESGQFDDERMKEMLGSLAQVPIVTRGELVPWPDNQNSS